MNVTDNKEENLKKAIEMIKNSKEQGADIAVLPEMFNCPYENEKFIEYAETPNDGISQKEISIARKEDIYVLAGPIPEKEVIGDKESIYHIIILQQ